MMKRKLMTRIGILACLTAACCLIGCAKKQEEPETTAAESKPAATIVLETEPEETEAEAESGERVEKDGQIESYLTGLMVPVEQGNRRPLAIMMSNDKAALPQYGINRAGVVYEAPVEGSMNRYMALIEDYDDLERIGSVRSCRTYYTYFAREFDAIYAHYGQSTFALPYLDNVDNINGLDGVGGRAYYRSSDRKSPHNAYSSGGRIKRAIEELGYRNTYADDYEGHFRFVTGKDEYVPSEGAAVKVVPGYPLNKPWFEYDEKDGVYLRYQYGGAHKGDEGQIAVKNIIFQYVAYGHYATTEYLNINVHESNLGLYFTNGAYEKITWKKDTEFGPTRYYDADGNEIKLNRGKTWICIIGADQYNKAEIYGN